MFCHTSNSPEQLSTTLCSHSYLRLRYAQSSSPPLPGRGELFPPLMATSFVQGNAICPPAALDFVVPSKVDDVSCLPGRVAVSFGRIGAAPGLHRHAALPGSMSINYGGSSTSQIVVELFL